MSPITSTDSFTSLHENRCSSEIVFEGVVGRIMATVQAEIMGFICRARYETSGFRTGSIWHDESVIGSGCK